MNGSMNGSVKGSMNGSVNHDSPASLERHGVPVRGELGSGHVVKGHGDVASASHELEEETVSSAAAAAAGGSLSAAAAALAQRLCTRAMRRAKPVFAHARLRAHVAAGEAIRGGELAVRSARDRFKAAVAAAAAAAAVDGTDWAAEADAALALALVRAEPALLAAAAGATADRPAARAAAVKIVGRACTGLVPDFFVPLHSAREQGRGPDPLGPLDIPCVFCWEGFDWAGPAARRPVLTPCCGRRLCAGCADAHASARGGGDCPFAHYACPAPAGALAGRGCRPDEELRLRWELARALGFEFPAEAAVA
jgi:hypothetical protein